MGFLGTLGYYICIPFAALLRLFYNLTGSYGLSLIFFTLVIKLVLLPFQMKSKKSMRFHPAIAPFKVAVLPLSKKLGDKAKEIQQMLSSDWMVDFDETGSIGKRYRREDEIGTPYCVTVDFDTVGNEERAGDSCVTVRDRDTMQQVRLPIDQLRQYLAEKLAY